MIKNHGRLHYPAVLCFVILLLVSGVSATTSIHVTDDQHIWSVSCGGISICPRIENITPNPAHQHDEVSFSASFKIYDRNGESLQDEEDGYCGDSDEYEGKFDKYISELKWTSDIDGNLSNNISFSTSMLSPGNHTILFMICDQVGLWSSPGIESLVVIENNAPDTPEIYGVPQEDPEDVVEYTFITSDYDGDSYYFLIDWGDNTTYESTSHDEGNLTIEHSFLEYGDYMIKAKAVDEHGKESEWGEFQVSLSKQMPYKTWFQQMIQRLSTRYPLFNLFL